VFNPVCIQQYAPTGLVDHGDVAGWAFPETGRSSGAFDNASCNSFHQGHPSFSQNAHPAPTYNAKLKIAEDMECVSPSGFPIICGGTAA
jgi:hypothetical protein